MTGGSGANGNFLAGDRPAIRFKLARGDGTLWRLQEMNGASALLSGPTTGYQLVIPLQGDVLSTSSSNEDGTYTYTMPAIPATFVAPPNDSPSFGTAEGERTGEALVDGTYTIGLAAFRTYNLEGRTLRDTGNAVFDVAYGTATAIERRELVTQANCDQCHSALEAHGGTRNDLRQCQLCHVGGAEDRNNPAVAGGTPGVTIQLGTMIHRVHNAAHLPSVVGVGTDAAGARDYSVAPRPLHYVGFQDRIFDMSHFNFPVMPSAYVAFLQSTDGTTYTGTGGNGPMPRDVGYAALSPANKLKEDLVRTGMVACAKCHGDPDGQGPLPAPAQGDLHRVATRNGCTSCHDDINWSLPYASNGWDMPMQPDDTNCTVCHGATDGILPMDQVHQNPSDAPAYNQGLNINLAAVGSGSFAAGDAISVDFSVNNNSGTPIPLNDLTRFQFMVIGPTENPQVVGPAVLPFDTGFRKSSPFTGNGSAAKPTIGTGAVAQTLAVAFTSATGFTVSGSVTGPANFTIGNSAGSVVDVSYEGYSFRVTQGANAYAAGDRYYYEAWPTAPNYNLNVPFDISFELVADTTTVASVAVVANAPLRWGRQTLFERTAVTGAGVLLAESNALDRLVVADNGLALLTVGDRVVIDDGLATEEYAQVGRIQVSDDFRPTVDLGQRDRIYFTTALRYPHAAGATVQRATLSARREGVHYDVLDAGTGTLALRAGGFSAGNRVIVSYRTDVRFGWRRAPGDALQVVFQPAAADSPEIGQEAGDWVGLRILPGTYSVGAWAHRDISVNPRGEPAAATRAWDDITTDDTTYRVISPPATRSFLYGGATTLTERRVVESGAACDTCHDKVQAHGNGRMGLATCLVCHTTPGMEDGPKFTFSSWYVPPTPGVTMDFRSLLHKVHMGKELAKKDEFEMIGVFLGKPYVVTLEEKGFSAQPRGVKDCAVCHGESEAWQTPLPRVHPDALVPVQTWTMGCNGCHDADAATAHMKLETFEGEEACATCHGPGREFSVEISHRW